ncbi:hypothetical protein Dimus_009767 [Dionaea muscipula]
MSSSSSPSSSQTGGDQGGIGSSGGRDDRGRRRRRGRLRRHHQLLQGESSSSAIAAAAAASAAAARVSAASSSRRRSSSFMAASEGVWPEPFVESLAFQVALDASVSNGRLAAAPAMAILFLVCSTWGAISRSELLWQNLTRRVWNATRHLQQTWRNEYIYRHRTARNFRLRRYIYTTLHFTDVAAPVPGNNNNDAGADHHLICLRIALSDHHLAAGFSDGSVRLFDLHSHLHLHTFRPFLRDLLGLFSRAVSGIVLSPQRVTFASLDGDVHVSHFAVYGGPGPGPGPGATRRARLGDVVNDGALVDFTGCERFWVGLYAGVPGRAIHIWHAVSEELLFEGGTLTDPEAVMGWHMFTEWTTEFVGRVRVTGQELAVAWTGLRVLLFDLRNQGLVVGEEDAPLGLIVGFADAADEAFMTADTSGVVSVRRVRTLEEVCRFSLRGAGAGATAAARGLLGCMNSGYAVMCVGGVVRAWEIEHGERLYRFRERIGEATALTASERRVAGSSSGRTIHVWDFGA